jgi:hypothetical protein
MVFSANNAVSYNSSTVEHAASETFPPFFVWIPFGQKLSIQNIKDLIPILELPMIWNQVFNILNGQFLAKRNSNEKWRERFTCRVFYGTASYRPQKLRNAKTEYFFALARSPKNTPHITQLRKWPNHYRTASSPMAYFRRNSANFYDIKIPIEPKWSSGPRAQPYWSAFALHNGLFVRRRPDDTPLFLSIISSSSWTLMMIAWKNCSTIIRIRVANAGEAGDEFVGLGGTLAGGDGRYQIDTADKKNCGEYWGNTTITNGTPVVAGGCFYFLPIQIMVYSNIFKCWCNSFNDDTQHNITCHQRESNNPP